MTSPKPRSYSDVGLLLLSLTLWSVVVYISLTLCNMTPEYAISLPGGSRGFEMKDYWVPPPWWGIAFHMTDKRWSNHNDICQSEENFTATLMVTPGNRSVFLYNHAPERGKAEDPTKTFMRTKKIIRLLNQNRRSVFIEVGAGTGAYSLGVGATKKHKVVSIEPLPDNARRLCRGIIASGLRWRNYIVTNALHSSHTDVILTPDETKPEKYTIKSLMTSNQGIMSFSILLDDLLKKFNITVAGLRISAMHNPYRIMKGGKEFFEKVDVIFVVMVWRRSKAFNGKYICHFLTDNSMLPFSNMDFSKALNIEDHHKWPSVVTWIRKGIV